MIHTPAPQLSPCLTHERVGTHVFDRSNPSLQHSNGCQVNSQGRHDLSIALYPCIVCSSSLRRELVLTLTPTLHTSALTACLRRKLTQLTSPGTFCAATTHSRLAAAIPSSAEFATDSPSQHTPATFHLPSNVILFDTSS